MIRLQTDLRRVIQRLIRRGLNKARPVSAVAFDAEAAIRRLPVDHQEAARRLVDPAVTRSLPYLRREHSVSRQGLRPEMAEFAVKLVAEFKRRDMPFFVASAYRGPAEQAALLKRGVSRAGPGQSPHNHGWAVDVVHFGRYWDLTRKEWAVVGLIGKEVARKMNLKITWGGDWDFYDPAHWEFRDWRKAI